MRQRAETGLQQAHPTPIAAISEPQHQRPEPEEHHHRKVVASKAIDRDTLTAGDHPTQPYDAAR